MEFLREPLNRPAIVGLGKSDGYVVVGTAAYSRVVIRRQVKAVSFFHGYAPSAERPQTRCNVGFVSTLSGDLFASGRKCASVLISGFEIRDTRNVALHLRWTYLPIEQHRARFKQYAEIFFSGQSSRP